MKLPKNVLNIKKAKFITGLDIGSSKISAVTAYLEKDGQFKIVGQATKDSKGVSRGSLVNLNDAVRSVSDVLKKLKEKVPGSLGDMYVNISGETLKGATSRGMIPISVRGREITSPDMARCVDAASTVHLPYNREIVHRVVQKFSVDDQPWIKNPLGLYASRVSCEVYIITAGVNSIQNIFKCVNNAGYDVKEVVYTGIADGSIVLNDEERVSGVLLLNIGAELTDISAFSDGALCDIEILQIGASDFKDDFRASPAFGDILSKVGLKFGNLKEKGHNIKSIVLTGGIIFADGVIEHLEEKLGCPVRMGVTKEIKGNVSGLDSTRLCTAIGLIKYASKKYENMPQNAKNLAQKVSSTVVDIFNNYF